MITRKVRGNIFTSGCRDIAFGVNIEGHNDNGFAGMVAARYWPQLMHPGRKNLGDVMSRSSGNYVFHALVCHHTDLGGFSQTPHFITVCLDAILAPDDVEIACVLVGGGQLGEALGADLTAILDGIERSSKRVAVYSL